MFQIIWRANEQILILLFMFTSDFVLKFLHW